MSRKFYRILVPFVGIWPLIVSASEETPRCTPETFTNCMDGVGPAVTGQDSLRLSLQNLSSNRDRGTRTEDNPQVSMGQSTLSGLAAGDISSGLGPWASFSHSGYEADIPINSTLQPIASYDADQNNILFGLDRLFGGHWVMGVALGYEDTDIETAYNGGNHDIQGFTLSPYAAFLLNEVFSLDATVGYSSLDYDTERIDNQSGANIEGDFESSRWFASANLNATLLRGPWVLNGRAGLLYSVENQDSYTETGPNTARSIGQRDIDLTQAQLFAEIAYSSLTFEPYLSVGYLRDLNQNDGTAAGGLPGSIGATQPDDDDEFQLGAGVRFYEDLVSGSLEWSNVQGRDEFDSQTLMLSIRADF